MNRLTTLRRIVLTGTPLQNNLKECKLINEHTLKIHKSGLTFILYFRLLYGAVCEAKFARKVSGIYESFCESHHKWPIHRLNCF